MRHFDNAVGSHLMLDAFQIAVYDAASGVASTDGFILAELLRIGSKSTGALDG